MAPGKPAKKIAAKKTSSIVKADQAVKTAVRRAPAKKTVAKPEPLSHTEVYIGERRYPLLTDWRCRVCRHPKRALIEEQILLGTKYTAIAKSMSERKHENIDGSEETWPELTPEMISGHFNNDHSPLDAYTMRDLQEQIVDIDEYSKVGTRVITGLGLAKRIIGDVEQGIVNGKLVPTVKEGIAAARIDVAAQLAKQSADEAEDDDQTWYYEQAFEVFFDKAKSIMDKPQFDRLLEELRVDPILNALQERRNQGSKESA